MIKLLSIDPGLRTGIAFKVDDIYTTCVADTLLEIFEIIDQDWNIILYEDFHGAGRISSEGNYTIRVIGAILALTWKLAIPVIAHEPSYRMSGVLEAQRILADKLHLKHEVEALSHLLVYEKLGY